MTRLHLAVITGWTLLLCSATVTADPDAGKTPAGPADAADRIKASLPKDKIDEPEVGPVARASAFLDLEVKDAKGTTLGEVDDLALDLQENFVALTIIDLDKSLGGKRVALPLGVVTLKPGAKHLIANVDSSRLTKAPTIDQDTKIADFDRARAAAAFKYFDQTPYWQRPGASAASDSGDSKLSGAAVFASLDDLVRIPLTNESGKQLGRIEDFAIAVKTGLIAYAAVVMNDKPQDQLYPLPLSAFVVRPQAKAWIVELPSDLIEQTHSIGTGDWPQKVDRAWVEYVHVRYGRSAFSGVRTELHVQGDK